LRKALPLLEESFVISRWAQPQQFSSASGVSTAQ